MATFSKGIQRVCNTFGISKLYEEQLQCLEAAVKKRNVYASLPAGYGKCMIFYALPIVADEVFGLEFGTSKVIVISPLKYLIDDQVKFLKSHGLKAFALNEEQDEGDIGFAEQGKAVYIFTAPEKVLSLAHWRRVICGEKYRKSLVGIVVDEAHCINQWGFPGLKSTPFRHWYGNNAEMRSLVSSDVPVIALTATASKSTKHKIFESLSLMKNSTFVLERNPDKLNIKFYVQYVKKDLEISWLFDFLIEDIRKQKTECERIIIFCQTRKQCAVVYQTFAENLGESLYVNCDGNCRQGLVDMYHAGTPALVKEHIQESLNNENGCIRILACTVAFRMGVNCQGVNRVIHFGPAKNLECYIQECGRSGRNGQPSVCLLLYNGLLAAHCNMDIKEYTMSNECRRLFIFKHFPGNKSNAVLGQSCYNICEINSTGKLQLVLQPMINGKTAQDTFDKKVRIATPEQKERLREVLYVYMKTLIISNSTSCSIVSTNLLREFTLFHINQVLKCCEFLNCIDDIEKYIEVWRREHSLAILKALADVFTSDNLVVPDISESEFDDYEESEVQLEWLDIRDDSDVIFFSESNLANLDAFMDAADQSGDVNRSTTSFIDQFINVSNTTNN